MRKVNARGCLCAAFSEGGETNTDLLNSNPLAWEQVLKFNWECMLDVAEKALVRGLDVVIDYVVEDELPLLQKLSKEQNAKLSENMKDFLV